MISELIISIRTGHMHERPGGMYYTKRYQSEQKLEIHVISLRLITIWKKNESFYKQYKMDIRAVLVSILLFKKEIRKK